MEGRQKVATLLLAIDPKVAAGLLSRFEKGQMADIVESMLAMDYVEDEAVRSVLAEFGQLWGEELHAVSEPRARARSILENAVGPEEAESYLGRCGRPDGRGDPFATLERLEPEQLATLLADEHAQTIAIVLARLEWKKAGQVLARLPQQVAGDVVGRMVSSERSAPAEVLRSVGSVLSQRVQAMAGGADPWATPRGRYAQVAKILSATPRATREAALGTVREQDPDAGEQVRNLMFLFDDLALLKPDALRRVVGSLDTQIIALALKTASDEIKERIFGAVSKRAAQTLREEQELLGPRPLSEVENAQQAFIDAVTQLQAAGEITIRRGGDDEELV